MTPDESIAALKELLLAEVAGVRALIDEKDARYADLVQVKTQAVLDLLREKDALYTDRDTARQTAVASALKAAQTGVDAAFAASEKAIGKSDQNAEKWRENANEWRQAMMDREIKFAARTETENEFRNLRTELATIVKSQAVSSGKGEGMNTSWSILIAVVVLIATLLTIGPKLFGGGTPAAPQVIYVPAPSGTQLPVTPPATVPR